MTHREETLVLASGKCRICGCTQTTPCTVPIDEDELGSCWWMDAGKTLCSNPHCVAEVPIEELIGMGYSTDYLIGEMKKAACR